MRIAVRLLPLALASGCYLSHGIDAPSDLDAGGAPRPARDVGPPSRDGGQPSRADARTPRPDAGIVLPPEPEPDPGPDERPTGPWDGGVSRPRPGEPALEPTGDVVVLDDASDNGGPPELVWNGSGWGVAWPGKFRTLDQDGRPTSPAVRITRAGWGHSLDFAAGHYALAVGGTPESEIGVAAFDRAGAQVTDWSHGVRGTYPDVGRLQVGHQWVSAAIDDEGTGLYRVFAYSLNGAMSLASDTLALASDGAGDVRVGGSKSRALVIWTTTDGVQAQSLAGPELRRDGEPFRVFEIAQHSDSLPEIEPFRDHMAVAGMDGRDVYLALADPWVHEVVEGPLRVGSSRVGDRRPGIAVAEEEGFLVVCYAVGTGPYGGGSGSMDGVTLQVVGADGALWGPPLSLVSGERNLGGVDCGWNGREIVVVWWRAAGDGAWNTIFSQRARPTFL